MAFQPSSFPGRACGMDGSTLSGRRFPQLSVAAPTYERHERLGAWTRQPPRCLFALRGRPGGRSTLSRVPLSALGPHAPTFGSRQNRVQAVRIGRRADPSSLDLALTFFKSISHFYVNQPLLPSSALVRTRTGMTSHVRFGSSPFGGFCLLLDVRARSILPRAPDRQGVTGRNTDR